MLGIHEEYQETMHVIFFSYILLMTEYHLPAVHNSCSLFQKSKKDLSLWHDEENEIQRSKVTYPQVTGSFSIQTQQLAPNWLVLFCLCPSHHQRKPRTTSFCRAYNVLEGPGKHWVTAKRIWKLLFLKVMPMSGNTEVFSQHSFQIQLGKRYSYKNKRQLTCKSIVTFQKLTWKLVIRNICVFSSHKMMMQFLPHRMTT